MLIGIFFSSLGVSFSVKSKLRATPIGVCPAVFSQPLKISTGTAMAIMLGIFLLIQIIILKREFRPFQVLQLAAMVIYGLLVDLITKILFSFPDEELWQQIIYCTLGMVILAFGVFIMLKANFIMLPQDAVVKVISNRYKKEYGKIKIALDSTLTAIAAVGSWIIYNKLVHAGIVTIAAAIIVGKINSKLKEFETLNRLLDRATGET